MLRSDPAFFVDIHGQTRPVIIRRASTSKRITLAYDMYRGAVVVTAPTRGYSTALQKFINAKSEWLYAQITKENDEIAKIHTDRFSILGREFNVISKRASTSHFWIDGDKITLHAPTNKAVAQFQKFSSACLKDYIQIKATDLAKQLGVHVKQITVKNLRSRWGSCNQRGEVCLAWHLLFAPTWVLDYVIAHEVAHLREMNHSAKFWQLVEDLHPNSKLAMKWLRQNSSTLWLSGRQCLKHVEMQIDL